jgi:hypothetical protein
MSSKDEIEPITAAERMRDYRRRRRNGFRCVRVLLHKAEISSLIERGFLPSELSHDLVAIEGAFDAFVHEALDPEHQKD